MNLEYLHLLEEVQNALRQHNKRYAEEARKEINIEAGFGHITVKMRDDLLSILEGRQEVEGRLPR
jgi:hypothetical protein